MLQANSKQKGLQTLNREVIVERLLQNAELAEKIKAVRNAATDDERKERKAALPAFLFQGKLDEGLYREYKKRCKQEGIPSAQQLGPRNNCFLQPTGLFMMDFDRDTNQAEELYRTFLATMEREGINYKDILAMAHRSVGGNGLRLVLKRRQGHTIEEDQQWIGTLMDEPIDTSCKDIARLSFMVIQEDIFHLDLDILFDDTLGEGFTNEGLWQPHQPLPTAEKKNKKRGRKKKNPDKSTAKRKAKPTTARTTAPHNRRYQPITHIDEENLIKELVTKTEEHIKQPIREGNRNNSYLLMAQSLMSLLNDLQLTTDLLIKTSAMCGHGLAEDEIRKTARSATRYTDNPFVPYYLCKYINNGSYRVKTVQMAS